MLYLVLLPMHIVNFVTIGQQFSELYRLFKMINKPLLGWLLCSYHDNNLSNNVIIRSPNTKTILTKNAFLSITGQDIPLLWQLTCSHHGYSPVSHLGLLPVHVVNFVTIGQQISELWRFLDLLIGGARVVTIEKKIEPKTFPEAHRVHNTKFQLDRSCSFRGTG